jgi:two-component system, cell cycle response regulator
MRTQVVKPHLSSRDNSRFCLQPRGKILVVDDDPLMRDLLRELLDSSKYHIIEAVSGESAITRACAEVPDLVLLDVMLPDLDGYAVCRWMREDPVLAEVPIVMITALADSEARTLGIDAGADDFLTKPVDPLLLRARVRMTLQLNRYRQLLQDRAKFEWVIHNSGDGFLVIKRDHVVCLNPQAKRYLHLKGNQMPKMRFRELLRLYYDLRPESDWDTWPAPLPTREADLDGDRRARFAVRPMTSASPAFWLEVDVLECRAFPTASQVVRLRDVTKNMEERQWRYGLDAQVSYKLRTPLSALVGSLELLGEAEEGLAFEQQMTLISIARQTANELHQTLSSVLDRQERLMTAPSDVWMGTTEIDLMVDRLQRNLNLRSVNLRNLASTGHIHVSPVHLDLILTELLTNAVKFHPVHQPEINILVEDIGRRNVRLTVQDDGVNLSSVQLERIWSPYYQGERTITGQLPGMGLGLPLVAILVWDAGGSSLAYNRADRPGLVVEITFPRHLES